MAIGRKLRKWREDNGLTQRAAAKRAGVSQAAWQNAETDQVKRIGFDVVRKIVAATDGRLSYDDFASRPARAAAG